MSQTRKKSLQEALVGTAIGFVISATAGAVLYPLHGAHFSMATNLWITAEFTVISVLRSYVVRRWFNSKPSATAGRTNAAPIMEANRE